MGALLERLGELGYRASTKKAQIGQRQVTYLGYLLEGGQRWLTESRKKAVALIPAPTNAKGLREFLGSAGFCRLWIPGFAEMAAPLYPLTKSNTPYHWGKEQQLAFDKIKRALLTAPALSLPDVTKPFTLYVDEHNGIAKGVLTQKLGPWKRPVAYFSKKLDSVAAGWPPCLRIIAAMAVLVKDSDKLTFGQPLTVVAPHAVETVIRQPPDRWLSNARVTHYQAMLLNSERIRFGTATSLNPATLLPETESASLVMHDCHQILAEVHGTRGDLTDQPLPDAEATWYTDGSSFLRNGERKAGAAVVDGKAVIWASALEPGTSAQRAELIALTQALRKDRLKALQIIQHQIWKPLAAVYRPGDTTGPHPFQIGDSVYVRRHQSRTLEPRWKGPYTVLLTTPTALKVDGIAAWVHASHVQRAPSTSTADASQDGRDEPLQWKLHRTQNPLKIRLSKIGYPWVAQRFGACLWLRA
ncbi:unnamed protein product [Nyctereutes procyonoides]|uniref:(raccoon dog) hypothetical protein n=1 Tax=Nyctereutes procyonoides TaxID=34880 RepID=A0A811YRF7_NYCPR|nr:unnamed protein product [Nyctereutes procyonoides]